MYEDMTFENIMDRCLDRVSSSIDKREGSVVYDAIAPAAAELAIMYIELAYLMDRAFPDTESGDDLTKKVRERSIFRTPATAAIRKGYFEDGNGAAMDVPIGTRFSGDNLNYTVTEKIATGQFRLLCETPGAAGNQYQGNLFPIDYVEGLGAARLADILINGEDEESDEDLLDRLALRLDRAVGDGDAGHLLQQPFDIGVGHDLERSGIVAHRVALLRGAQRLGLLDDGFDLHARPEFDLADVLFGGRDLEGGFRVVVAQKRDYEFIFAVCERRDRHGALEARSGVLFLVGGACRGKFQHGTRDRFAGLGIDHRTRDRPLLGKGGDGEKRK